MFKYPAAVYFRAGYFHQIIEETHMEPYVRKAHFYETDQMGVIHHSNYIRWFEEARVDFMDQLGYGYERNASLGIDFAVLSVSCEYKSMVCFGDTVEVKMRISEFSPVRMTISYEITDSATGRLVSTGYTKHCYFDKTLGKPVSLKKHLPDLYDLFLRNSDAG